MVMNVLSARPRRLAWPIAILVAVLSPAIGCTPEGAGSVSMAEHKKAAPPAPSRDDKAAGPAPLVKKGARAPGPLPKGDR
jgi:hypothetical protein